MGAIREEIEITGTSKSKKIQALFDSGAYRNYIKRKFADGELIEDIGFHIFEGIQRIILADGSIVKGEKVRFKEIKIKNCCGKDPEFVIMDDLIDDVIIGVHLMQSLDIRLDPPGETIETTRNLMQ